MGTATKLAAMGFRLVPEAQISAYRLRGAPDTDAWLIGQADEFNPRAFEVILYRRAEMLTHHLLCLLNQRVVLTKARCVKIIESWLSA